MTFIIFTQQRRRAGRKETSSPQKPQLKAVKAVIILCEKMRILHSMNTFILLILLLLIFIPIRNSLDLSSQINHVQVFHYIIHYWGALHTGVEMCLDAETGEANILCEFFNDKNLDLLENMFVQAGESRSRLTRTVALYNIHYLHQSLRLNKPNICKLRTNLTMAESGNPKSS